MDHLSCRPSLSKELQHSQQNDLKYGLSYMDAVQVLKDAAYQAGPGLHEIHRCADKEGVYPFVR
jgi:hypothetical protein